jgi:hypothetical protein
MVEAAVRVTGRVVGSALREFGSLFDLSGRPVRPQQSSIPDAIGKDWEQVGSDLRRAMENIAGGEAPRRTKR